LSVGAIGLILQLEGQIGIRFNVWAVTLPYLALMLPGWWLHKTDRQKRVPTDHRGVGMPFWASVILFLLLLIISAAILFNAAYWPFYLPDARAIYKNFAVNMLLNQGLLPLRGVDWYSYYQAYPMLVPLNYVYVYMVSGWENEYLAKVISTLLSLGCLPAVYVLGTILQGRSTGLIGMFLLGVTPAFARWASSGYVDLPMAFYYTLATIFAWRLVQQMNTGNAALTGLMAGFAALTKNAGLVGIALLVAWLTLMWLRRRIPLTYLILVAGIALLIPAPWYIRNWVEAQLIFPPTAWTDQAQRTGGNLLVFVARPENFLVTGWLVSLGVLFALSNLFVPGRRDSASLLLMLTAPFFAVWWWLVSYDPRFLLLFLPLLCVMGAIAAERIWLWLPRREALQPLLLVVAIGLGLYMLWISVDYKEAILHHPLMADASKRSIVLSQQ
jgi:4-amino-4-deoxy-L-arabinose transferase-like glycosyltransferase